MTPHLSVPACVAGALLGVDVGSHRLRVLDIIDDHSRLAIASHARRIYNAADVVDAFDTAFNRWGLPASVLTDRCRQH